VSANDPTVKAERPGSLWRGGIVLALFALGALLALGPFDARNLRILGGAVLVLSGLAAIIRRRDVAEWSDLLHLGSSFPLTSTQHRFFPLLWGAFCVLFGSAVIVVTAVR
jgi:hypothetical protein